MMFSHNTYSFKAALQKIVFWY